MKKHSFTLFILLLLGSQLFSPVKLCAQTTGADSITQLKSFVGKYQFTFDVIFTKASDDSVTQAVVNNKDVWLKDK